MDYDYGPFMVGGFGWLTTMIDDDFGYEHGL